MKSKKYQNNKVLDKFNYKNTTLVSHCGVGKSNKLFEFDFKFKFVFACYIKILILN